MRSLPVLTILLAASVWHLSDAYTPAPKPIRRHRKRPIASPILLVQAQQLIRDFQTITNPNVALTNKRQRELATAKRRPLLDMLQTMIAAQPQLSSSVTGLTTLFFFTHLALDLNNSSSEALGVARWAAANAFLIALVNRYVRETARRG